MGRTRMLSEFTGRDEAHQELEAVLREGAYPGAECRENPNAEKPYQVWSGSESGGE